MSNMINTNIASLNAQNNLNKSQGALTTSLQRLSSGLRINSAKDDAAGMAIADRMTSQIKGTDQAARNANDGISLTQTAEGDLTTISDNLQRMRELSVQSANGSNSVSDRASIDNEVQALSQEIDRVAQNSSFNGNKLLDGSFTAQKFQIGANATANDTISVSIGSARTSALGGSGTSTATTVSGTAVSTTALAAGDVTLNGFQVGASAGGASPGQDANSAYSKALAINAVSSQSGVTATADVNKVSGVAADIVDFTAIAADTFSINGVSIGDVAAGTNAAGQGANVAAAINKQSSQTGVTATADATTGALTLSAADGRNIEIGLGGSAADAGAAAADKATFLDQTGLATAAVGTKAITAGAAAVSVVNTGTISLSSNSADGITVGGAAIAKAGLTAGPNSPTTTLSVNSIASIDVKTAAGATNAISAIDGALATVNSARASLGVYQNRFASVVSNLNSTTENLSASRSRIQDTDFAKETASLTRGQILQQAGTAMLAQANSLPNGVLSLLR
jgi:flagellin